MSDLISREDAIKAVAIAALDDRDELEAIKALPSADAVSREDYEKIKNMVSTQFQTVLEDYLELEKRYVALLGKQSQKPSADAEPSLKAIKRQIDEHWYLDPPPAEAVQGEWVRKYDDKVNCYWYECDQCGEYRPRNQFGHEYNANFCPNCGAKMKGGDDE